MFPIGFIFLKLPPPPRAALLVFITLLGCRESQPKPSFTTHPARVVKHPTYQSISTICTHPTNTPVVNCKFFDPSYHFQHTKPSPQVSFFNQQKPGTCYGREPRLTTIIHQQKKSTCIAIKLVGDHDEKKATMAGVSHAVSYHPKWLVAEDDVFHLCWGFRNLAILNQLRLVVICHYLHGVYKFQKVFSRISSINSMLAKLKTIGNIKSDSKWQAAEVCLKVTFWVELVEKRKLVLFTWSAFISRKVTFDMLTYLEKNRIECWIQQMYIYPPVLHWQIESCLT